MKSITIVDLTPGLEEEVYDVVCPIHGKLLSGLKFTLASTYSQSHDRIWADEH